MSYPPPGSYPAPQSGRTGALSAAPPPTVQRAFTLMLVGAGLAAVNVVLEFVLQHQIQQRVQEALSNGTITSNTSVNIDSAGFGGVIGIGLWIWMAFANRGGHNWARVTGTVFFGIACLGLLVDIAVFAVVGHWLGAIVIVVVLAALASWTVGLLTVILLWKKQSSAFFNPPAPMPYYPQPGYGYGYPVPPPGAPMQEEAYVQQPPSDPWQTPGG